MRDPQDTAAPQLAWGGALSPASAGLAPATFSQPTLLQAQLTEAQLMRWMLEAAPSNGDVVDDSAWRTLAEQNLPASRSNALLDLTTLDPAHWANGVYELRLRAWDLSGRETEIASRILVDSSTKALTQASATDAVFQLGAHQFALTRSLATQAAHAAPASDLGNWSLPLLDTTLSTDQPATTATGATAAWREGARLWLTVPADLGRVAGSSTWTTASCKRIN